MLWKDDSHLRLIASFADLFVDTASIAVDRTVLCPHDHLDRTFCFDVASKPRDFRDDDDDL